MNSNLFNALNDLGADMAPSAEFTDRVMRRVRRRTLRRRIASVAALTLTLLAMLATAGYWAWPTLSHLPALLNRSVTLMAAPVGVVICAMMLLYNRLIEKICKIQRD